MKKTLVSVILVIALSLMSVSLASAAVIFSDNFESGSFTNWTTQNGSWSIVTDGTKVFQQNTTGAEGRAWAKSGSSADQSVEMKVKVTNFNGSNRALVCARMLDGNNYYALSFTTTTLDLRKKISGSSTVLTSKSLSFSANTWYTIKLQVSGSTLTAYVNGVSQLTATTTGRTSGVAGMVAWKVTARFDDVVVDDLGGGGGATPTPPTVTPTNTNTPTPSVGAPTPTNTNTPTPSVGQPTPTNTNTPTPSGGGATPSTQPGGPAGWAAVNYLSQNGTTGGTGGQTITVTSKSALDAALDANDNPAIIVVQGTLTGGPAQNTDVSSNKTIIGSGSGAYMNFGFNLRGNNIIIKNLDVMNGGFNPGDSEGYDTVTFADSNCHHVWVDHCTMHETLDGLVDPTRSARFVSITWNKFHTQKTACLIAGGDGESGPISAQSNSDKREWHYTVTVAYNYWVGVYERGPRVRFGAVHVLNNYYDNNVTYAIGRGDRANIYSENNYFLNTHDAFAAYDDSSNQGYVQDVGSLFEGDNGNTTDNPPSGNFVWTPSQYYSYIAYTAQWVKDNLKNYTGIGKSNP